MAIVIDSDIEYISAVKGYFDKRVANLHKMANSNGKEFELEILLLSCCYIDALAGIFTNINGVNERFTEILIYLGYTNDVDFSKINLLILEKQIREHNSKNQTLSLPQKYDNWVSGEISKRDYSSGDNVTLDLFEKDVLTRIFAISSDAEKAKYEAVLKKAVRKATYAEVLYENYRNAAVHEALVKGHWEGATREDRPFYVAIIDDEPDLTFPGAFLIKVVENMIARIYKECTDLFYANEFGIDHS